MKILKPLFVIIIIYLILINLALIHLAALTLYLYLALSMPFYLLLYYRYEKTLQPSVFIHGIIIAGPIASLLGAVILTGIIL